VRHRVLSRFNWSLLNLLKGGTVQIFGNNSNKSNSIQEEIKSRLESFGEESFGFQFAIQKFEDQNTQNCKLTCFCMGMKRGLSH
jgi:hypothetical protein